MTSYSWLILNRTYTISLGQGVLYIFGALINENTSIFLLKMSGFLMDIAYVRLYPGANM